MPLYDVHLSGNAWVVTTYRVEADSEEEARQKAMKGDGECTHEEVSDHSDTYADAYPVESEPKKAKRKGPAR